MRTWLAGLSVVAVLAGCERRNDRQDTRSGTDTIIRSSTVKDTTIVRADTAVKADTVHKAARVTTDAGDTAAAANLRWGPQPPGLPPGGRAAVVRGDPTKAGAYMLRAELPDGYEVKPHWHPASERIRVMSGTLMMGEGRNWRSGSLQPLAAGEGVTMAANQPHFVRAKGKTVIEIQSTGPFEITYANPSDDPRKSPIP